MMGSTGLRTTQYYTCPIFVVSNVMEQLCLVSFIHAYYTQTHQKVVSVLQDEHKRTITGPSGGAGEICVCCSNALKSFKCKVTSDDVSSPVHK